MATETERKRSRGLKRKRAAEQQQEGSGLNWRYVAYGVAGLLGIALIAFLVIRFGGEMPGEKVASLGNMHIDPPQQPPAPYNSVPPTSGPHYGNLAQWGEHEDQIPDPLQIHNLEDGGVIVQYNCPDGCPELVEQLREAIGVAFGDGDYEEAKNRAVGGDAHWILAPYTSEGMDSRIALTAWTRIDKFDEYDQERVVRFLRQYEGLDHHVR